MHRVIVVGGGVGGLELATRLGRRWGTHRSQPKASITLVDTSPAHLWKPLLHEVAAGSVETATHQLAYAAQAKLSGFYFQQGSLKRIDRTAHRITIDPVTDDRGVTCLEERTLVYDTLVLAIGSVSNFFNVPGAAVNSFALDNVSQAEECRRRLITVCLKTQDNTKPSPLRITVIGAGATGVELAAELHHTIQTLGDYGVHHLDPKRDIHITVIEAAHRILLALPEKTAGAIKQLLHKLCITVKTGDSVVQVDPNAVHLKSGEVVSSDLTIWAAGIKAPGILATLDGLKVNRQDQIVVHPTLQSISDPDIFAFGDCASCPWLGHPDAINIPPRAQAAHQQANFLFKQFRHRLNGQAIIKLFHYRDFGALVTLGHGSVIGNLRDGITTDGFLIRGWIARWMYASLYCLHIAALQGWFRMILDTLGKGLSRLTRPRVKLH